MAEPRMSTQEKKWQAESDAHTLAQAEVVKNDKARLDAAVKTAQRLAKEDEERSAAMKKVSLLDILYEPKKSEKSGKS